jgi:amicyanin
MKKPVIIVVAIIAVLGVGAAAWMMLQPDPKVSTNSGTMQPDSMQNDQADSTQSETESAIETNVVKISNFEFTPTKIKIKKGTTVTWTNDDSIRHDVKPDSETEEFKPSELLGKGEKYSVTFNAPGTYRYHCSPHPYMKGTVEVVE